ncbi:hypothetical protein CDAR_23791 [Caerostris darwini]|uniref:Uncharacterized protein n=1 Tax=Caerostris darwini TaxID=1538125 RepID=A0AAV4TY31_9ARAC|nr:hypothetical protein CDAR_23791 [Caerostris darwini]
MNRYEIFETTSIIQVHRSLKYFPIGHQLPAFPDFHIYFLIPGKYGQWCTIGNNRRTPGIIILRFEDDHPTTDLRIWETTGVEDRFIRWTGGRFRTVI